MDLRTTIRELDELISRTQSVIDSETASLLALPRSRLRHEKQQRVRSMRTQMRRLRNQRKSITTPQRTLRPRIA
jgi:hypothetical protein